MDAIKVASGIAAAAMIAASGWMLFHMPPPAKADEEPQYQTVECGGREWTASEFRDIVLLAQVTWGEARGVDSTMEKAAVIWCVLNRVDNDRWADNVPDVLRQPWQFAGFDDNNPVEDEIKLLAADVYGRWLDEKETGQDAGRVLPEDYYFFHGARKHNHFRKEYNDTALYMWTLPNPYED